ncbi:MAG: DUF1330 domain-containing protein [Rhodospirillaceae bacterium]|nr:DUF1330 domain-containing protein [Rhodospirillaceae bacterium]
MLRAFCILGAFMTASLAAAEERCAPGAPAVDMIIVSVVTDTARYVQYRAALAKSQLIPRLGGEVLAVGTRLAAAPTLLEGTWPENRHTFAIRWPCEAAARAFWESPEYQTEILPLRVGAGTFDVALFPAYAPK